MHVTLTEVKSLQVIIDLQEEVNYLNHVFFHNFIKHSLNPLQHATHSLRRAHLDVIKFHMETDGYCAVQGATSNIQHLPPLTISSSCHHSNESLLHISAECIAVFQ